MVLIPEPLTAKAFAPFGDVIEANEAARSFLINGGTTERFHDLAVVTAEAEGQAGHEAARVGISVFRGQARTFPLTIGMLERHPKGSQAFMPLQDQAYFVVVAPQGENDKPDLGGLRLFYASSKQGVNYHQGTWHHPLLALSDNADFLVVDRIGGGPNCDEFFFPDDDPITIDAAL
ncbi:ureidoglycolate lyase [Marinomonas pollencensis]|uniref:Ureidoglycolate lyase n=1 Tax=Marinomonas pollencensis TaxID=491954 RepID=A0A3E0DIE7_9GAMM|nr:ureidoglycolate lyase [Marinomonas pollencensis]REG81813.1 ureidoglycolate lyase [Marinomonas pollencensis]